MTITIIITIIIITNIVTIIKLEMIILWGRTFNSPNKTKMSTN